MRGEDIVQLFFRLGKFRREPQGFAVMPDGIRRLVLLLQRPGETVMRPGFVRLEPELRCKLTAASAG
jgi:hypothetical protein